MTREVLCPTCKKKTLFSPENPFRPFCSERCRVIDLGDWASGKHAIPQQTNDEDDANLLSKTQDDAESDGE